MHVFSEAMARVIQSRPGCQGVIVGGPHDLEPDYAKWLQERVKALGLDQKVTLVGQANQRSRMACRRWTSLSTLPIENRLASIVVEAMSLGKPVVATKPGGPEEIVEDQKNGNAGTFWRRTSDGRCYP